MKNTQYYPIINEKIDKINDMTIFEKGDKVFDIRWGWGKITNIEEDGVYIVKFTNRHNPVWYLPWVVSKILSYTEYKLDGQSLRKPQL